MPRLYSSSVSAVRLMEETPDLIRDVVVNSILHDKVMLDEIVKSKFTGINAALNKLYRYGRDKYSGGLPQTIVNVPNKIIQTDGESLTFIQQIYPEAAVVYNAYITETVGTYQAGAENQSLGYEYFGYEYLESIGRGTATINYCTYTGGISFEVNYTYLDLSLNPVTRTKTFTKAGFDPTAPYFVIRWATHVVGVPIHTWVYKIGSGEFPDLDSQVRPPTLGEFYPVIPIRYDGHNVQDVDFLKGDIDKMLNTLSISLGDFTQLLEDNPDIDSIVDATVLFGVDINSDTQFAKKYWYNLLSTLIFSGDDDSTGLDAFVADPDNDGLPYDGRAGIFFNNYVGDPATEAPRADTSGNMLSTGLFNPPTSNIWNPALTSVFTSSISWNYITSNDYTGVIAPEGEYISSFNISPTEDDDEQIESSVTFSFQTGANSYTSIMVHGLLHTVTGGRVGVTSDIVAGDLSIYKTLGNAVDEDYSFYVPIDVITMNTLSLFQREQLLYEALRLVVYAEDSAHLPWYADPDNQIAISVGIFIISIITWQPQLNAIYAAGWSFAAAVMVFEIVATNLLIKAAVDYIVEEYGAENATIALFIIAAAAYAAGDIVNLAEYFTVENLLLAVTELSSGINRWVDESYEALTQEAEDFYTSAEEKQEELDAAQEMLTYGDIDPFYIIDANRYIISNETPEGFYNRTIHTGNPGVNVLDTAQNFVAHALTLPDNVSK